ncbi:MAG: CBS domain-containing protein [Gammaproteobacteria bacterium]|nr:CBS domain-containing protein [Gammaproteobacteria bacterium]
MHKKGPSIDHSVIKELRHLQIFKQLDDPDLLSMLECLEEQHHEMGKILFQTGDSNQKVLYVLYRGRVGLWGPRGEKYEVDPGTILGLSNYMDGLPFVFTAIALTPISLLVVRRMEHQQLEQACPALNKLLNHLIANQIRSRQTTQQSFTGGMIRPAKAAMKTPLATCGPEVSLIEAFRLMDERKIGSLVVTAQNGELLGVLTYAGLAEAVLVRESAPHDNVMKVACERAYTVTSDTPLWEVEEVQHRNALKYVIVTEKNRPLGMISQTDILHSLLAQKGGTREEVRNINNFSNLAKMANRLTSIAGDARERNQYASTALKILSEFHLALQRRCVELTLREMAENGQEAPAVNYALLIMGSAGRKEMLLDPEQDNGIIIDGSPKALSNKTRTWFKTFTEHLNQRLEDLGYTLYFDDIKAKNPMFHMTLEEWREHLSKVMTSPTKEAAHWANVFMDFDTLYGDEKLTENLQQHVLTELKQKPGLLKMMVQDNAEWRPPIGFFNQLMSMGHFNPKGGPTTKGKIDIKCNGLHILTDGVRIYALQAGLKNRNTLERLTGLVMQGVLTVEYAYSLRAAYEALLEKLLVHQVKRAEKGKRLDKLIKPRQLSTMDHEILRMSMRVIKDFQEQLQADFK